MRVGLQLNVFHWEWDAESSWAGGRLLHGRRHSDTVKGRPPWWSHSQAGLGPLGGEQQGQTGLDCPQPVPPACPLPPPTFTSMTSRLHAREGRGCCKPGRHMHKHERTRVSAPDPRMPNRERRPPPSMLLAYHQHRVPRHTRWSACDPLLTKKATPAMRTGVGRAGRPLLHFF